MLCDNTRRIRAGEKGTGRAEPGGRPIAAKRGGLFAPPENAEDGMDAFVTDGNEGAGAASTPEIDMATLGGGAMKSLKG